MSLPLDFRPIAAVEFDAAVAWYEDQRPGLGSDFAAQVQQVLNTIADHPDRYRVADRDVREALVSRFPYCIYYRIKRDRIVVIAVFHTSRDPSILQSRN